MGLTACIFKQSGERHLVRSQKVFKRPRNDKELWVGPGLPPFSFLHDRERPIDAILCFTSFACQYVLGISPYQFTETLIVLLHSCLALSSVAAPRCLQLPYQGCLQYSATTNHTAMNHHGRVYFCADEGVSCGKSSKWDCRAEKQSVSAVLLSSAELFTVYRIAQSASPRATSGSIYFLQPLQQNVWS